MLSIFDKIIEKLMHKRMYEFLQEHNILFQNQFGFRKNNSTTLALIEITEKIKETIDNKKYGCGIFIDLRKAYDIVNHDILLKKLEHYGIRGNALKWFRSYLTNRKQYVINRELRKLDTWLIVNRLSLNIAKTKFLVFHPDNKPMKQMITLKIHKKAISESEYIKYLDIMVDSTLSWNIHIDKISKTISRATGLLYKIRPFVNNKTLKMLYYSLVYPHLNYVTEVWGSADPIHLTRIFILQKRIVRMLTHNEVRQNDYSFLASNPLFLKLEILKIQDLFCKVKIGKFIYKCLNKNTPINFRDWFLLTSQIHNYNTRSGYTDTDQLLSTKNLFIPTARTSHYGLKKSRFSVQKYGIVYHRE